MTNFSHLPTELQHQILHLSKPTVATIHMREEDYSITSISQPPSLLTVSKASRAIALSWGLQTYPIWTTDDWQDLYICPDTTTLELIITPSTSSSLNITWTELHAILGNALLQVKHLHIVCEKPERLVRLFMQPEADLVTVGESCVEKGLFGSEVLATDGGVREGLRSDILLTISKTSIEDGGNDAVEEWKLVDVEFSTGLDLKMETFTGKTFERVGKETVVGDASGKLEVIDQQECQGDRLKFKEWMAGGSRYDLTTENLDIFNWEMEQMLGDFCPFTDL